MDSFLKALSASSSGMAAQGQRLRITSENVANADTPGYRRKTISFQSEVDANGVAGVKVGRVRPDRSDLAQIYDPGHPMADERGMVIMSNVNIITEMADAREAQRSFEANQNIFTQARKMYAGALELLKR